MNKVSVMRQQCMICRLTVLVTGVCDSYFTTSGYWCKGLSQPFPNQVVIGAKTSGDNESRTEKQVKMKQSSRSGEKVKANRSDPAGTIWQNCIMWHPGMRTCCLVRTGWVLGLAFSISHNMRTSCDHVVRNIHYWEEDSVNCRDQLVSACFSCLGLWLLADWWRSSGLCFESGPVWINLMDLLLDEMSVTLYNTAPDVVCNSLIIKSNFTDFIWNYNLTIFTYKSTVVVQ